MEYSARNGRLISVIPEVFQSEIINKASLIEAVFKIVANCSLQFDIHGWDKKAADYLDHAVTRKPDDLRSHVQRIHVHIHRQDVDALYGALLDLFIVLKEKGRPLRERMLKLSQTVLGEDKYRVLLNRLDTSVTDIDVEKVLNTSLLSYGVKNPHYLIQKIDTREGMQQYLDPQQEARDHLEYGQVDEAREVLENAILEDPLQQGLHHDLLEIYKTTKSRELFKAMHSRLNINSNPLADAWHEMARYFEKDI
ncbi:MAG: hypothetical protein KZQ91_18350 [Candidatus Thiodiazotropha sp. (ex Lucinoma borealis)]|nr:hypothetical protein [Candidatus Thiodiazotropha sp. (ex Lucinoma borealis)]